MKNTKLLYYLASLSKVEFNALRRLVQSPFFNANQDCFKLLACLNKYYPEFSEEDVSRKEIFKELFPKEKFNEQKLRYVMTDLTRLLEEYFVYINLEKEKGNKRHLLVKELVNRKLSKYAKQHQVKGIHEIDNSSIRDMDYHFYNLQFHEDAYLLSTMEDNRGVDDDLQSLSNQVNLNFISKKLRYSCEIINRMNVLGVEYSLPFLPSVLKYLEDNPHEEVPAIAVYHKVFKTLKFPELELHYYDLKKVLKENHPHFTIPELRDLWGFVQNYCIRKINTGNADFLQELFENYQFLIVSEIIVENGFLAQFDFKNIVTIALRLKKHNWVEDFIKTKSELLEKTHRFNAVQYNLARLHNNREQYRDALRKLLSVEFTDVYYHLDSKVLLLKIYYELDDYEPLLSLIDTFRVYLRRNKTISEYQKKIYTNFTQYVKKLTRKKLGSKKALKEIESELELDKQVADLSWLKEKIEELKPN